MNLRPIKGDPMEEALFNEYKSEIQKNNIPKASQRLSEMLKKDIEVKADLDTFGKDHTTLATLRVELQTLQQTIHDISSGVGDHEKACDILTAKLKTVAISHDTKLDSAPTYSFDGVRGILSMNANFSKLSWNALKTGPRSMIVAALEK